MKESNEVDRLSLQLQADAVITESNPKIASRSVHFLQTVDLR